MILLNEDEAVELQGGSEREREAGERRRGVGAAGGERGVIVVMAWQEAMSQDSLPPPDGYFGPN